MNTPQSIQDCVNAVSRQMAGASAGPGDIEQAADPANHAAHMPPDATTPPTAASPTASTPPATAADTHAWLNRLEQTLNKQIFFVVGCQKSGTTWVQKLLDGHPAVRCRGEAYFGPVLLPMLQQAMQGYNQRHKAGAESHYQAEDLKRLFTTAMGLTLGRWIGDQSLEQVQAVGDKTPEHALCLPILRECFPNVKVIHITRDGRDVCTSGWFHNLRKGSASFKKQFPTMASYVHYTTTKHWMPYIQQAMQFGVQHPTQYHQLRYEDLHQEPNLEVGRMLTFLNVDASAETVEKCVKAGSFESLSGGRGRGEEDKQSFFRKGVVGDWQNHLDAHALKTFIQHGGHLLKQLGYES